MIIRVARELHLKISDVLQFDTSELMLWRAVYEEEYYEANPNKRPKENLSTAEELKNFFRNAKNVKHKASKK